MVDDELRACEDYVRSMRTCLASEGLSSRPTLGEHAYGLQVAASYLVQATQDVERWLGTCSILIKPAGPDRDHATTCTLPAGHPGSHDDHPPMNPSERIREEARHIAAQTTQLTNRLAWLTIHLEQDTATASAPANSARHLNELTTKLNALSYDLARLAKDTAALTPSLHHEPQAILEQATQEPQPTRPTPAPGIDR